METSFFLVISCFHYRRSNCPSAQHNEFPMYIHKLPAAFAPARLPEFVLGSNADRSRRTFCAQAPETFVRAVARNVDVPNEKRVGHDRGAVTCRCDVASTKISFDSQN